MNFTTRRDHFYVTKARAIHFRGYRISSGEQQVFQTIEGEYRKISAGWIKTKIRSWRKDEKELGIVLGNGLTRPARSITKEVSDS